ncbi:MAG: hypothetical protein Q7J57_07145, partial [Gemmobacter sp.]|nr:hypothetical protein [Gemmobacter sp.]
VEDVPFSETRTYIMRVSEALTIYRARAAGVAGPVDITGLLKGTSAALPLAIPAEPASPAVP